MKVNGGSLTLNDAGSAKSDDETPRLYKECAAQTESAWLDGTGAVLEVSGDLDVYSVPRLHAVLLDAHQSGWIRVIVDMTELDFMDSNGLGALIGGMKQARAAGGCLVLAAVPEKVLKILLITGITRVLPVFDAVPEAIAFLNEACW
jgi:anti-sigma B factor antagonist